MLDKEVFESLALSICAHKKGLPLFEQKRPQFMQLHFELCPLNSSLHSSNSDSVGAGSLGLVKIVPRRLQPAPESPCNMRLSRNILSFVSNTKPVCLDYSRQTKSGLF